MEPVVAAALINGPIALLVGTLTYHVGRSQMRTAQQSALETAKSSHQTALEAARRSSQREAYAKLVSSTRLYLARTGHALDAAEELDKYAERSDGLEHDEASGVLVPAMEVDLPPELASRLANWVNNANDHSDVVEAAAVAIFEGPEGCVAKAAERVEELTEMLYETLSSAGYWPESEEEGPDQYRSEEAHGALKFAIDGFAKAARAHLNGHQNAPGI